ncbi:MAG: NAD(P)-dependent oxidoreductase, partial [Ignavibacteriaceae bacterium]|nr:NAD(P)-dependent oxidoreductase [Ignavibacteriaceae bacterium]NNL20263.1 NAD(P)-dependent oxidoreductase [Ignavibacteriaceae bacterium]
QNIKRFLVVSSQTVTGPSYDGEPVNEETECKPQTNYARSKYAQEKLVLTYKDKIPVTICRAPAIFGERDTEIFIYFQTFSKGLTSLIGFDKKVLSLLHVADLSEGLYLAATSEKSIGEIYFISSEKYYTWDEVGETTSKVLNKKALKIRIPHFIVFIVAAVAQFFAMFSSKPATLNIEKAKDLTQHAWICDTSKAIKDFGYRQKVSIEEGIKRTCEWYKQMKWI